MGTWNLRSRNPACKVVHMVSERNQLEDLPIVSQVKFSTHQRPITPASSSDDASSTRHSQYFNLTGRLRMQYRRLLCIQYRITVPLAHNTSTASPSYRERQHSPLTFRHTFKTPASRKHHNHHWLLRQHRHHHSHAHKSPPTPPVLPKPTAAAVPASTFRPHPTFSSVNLDSPATCVLTICRRPML